MTSPLITFSTRLRETPFTERVLAGGANSFTVCNRMCCPAGSAWLGFAFLDTALINKQRSGSASVRLQCQDKTYQATISELLFKLDTMVSPERKRVLS